MVAEWKKKEVKKLKELIERYPVIGVVDLYEVPSEQVQRIRKNLKGEAEIKMSRKSLILRALRESKKENIGELSEGMGKMPALIFSDLDAFKLAKVLRENKQKAKAKPGMIAPKDIKVEEGPTSFRPGPVLSKFGNLGIPTDVEKGKVVIQEDTTVVEKGEKVGKEAANLLTKLGIKPREIGLALKAAWEAGRVYSGEELRVEPEEWIEKLKKAYSEAMNLAVNTRIYNEESVKTFLRKAENETKALKNSIEI